MLEQARHGRLPGQVRTGVTFQQAADEWLRYVEHDRGRKPSTVAGYRALVRTHLLPTFGELPIESIATPMIESWLSNVERAQSTRLKTVVLMHGIFKRARKLYGLPYNPVADVEKRGAGLASRRHAHTRLAGQRSTPKQRRKIGARPGYCFRCSYLKRLMAGAGGRAEPRAGGP